ncbi:hypothetical protein ACHQM5_006557 [Ranunculus cassubicifolius]
MAILIKNRTFIKSLYPRTISTFTHLYQQPQLSTESPLPPNPSLGAPIYNESWRNPNSTSTSTSSPAELTQSLVPLIFNQHTPAARIQALSQTLDSTAISSVLGDWMASNRWMDMIQLFEFWIKCLDRNGKPNKPDVGLFNQYLRAHLMSGMSAGELIDQLKHMELLQIVPNTASFNLVLKAMYAENETVAAQKLLERMLQTGKESLPDEESYDLIMGMLFSQNEIDAALKYLDLTLKSGYTVSLRVFTLCVQSCVNVGRLDTLVSIIERCKAMDQNKSLCPSWNLSNYLADTAIQQDNSKLAFLSLEFLAKWIARGEINRPPLHLSADEGLIVSALGTAARTYNPTLLDGSWAILRRSLRQRRPPLAESYLARIFALSSLGQLQRAFNALNEFESVYGQSTTTDVEDLFSPFTSLSPLVVACSKQGFETLDKVYFELEKLSKADPPYKSVAALNCIVLGCANIWDLDRAYQTFEAISGSFELTPDIHSYNALLCAFGKQNKTHEATGVFDHLVSLNVKPNATTYSLLVDAHLVNRDPPAALSVIDDMVAAGLMPTKEMLKKIRRRCVREFDEASETRVIDLAGRVKIRLGGENRRNMLFDLNYGTTYS